MYAHVHKALVHKLSVHAWISAGITYYVVRSGRSLAGGCAQSWATRVRGATWHRLATHLSPLVLTVVHEVKYIIIR
jgi:hypothetical protein